MKKSLKYIHFKISLYIKPVHFLNNCIFCYHTFRFYYQQSENINNYRIDKLNGYVMLFKNKKIKQYLHLVPHKVIRYGNCQTKPRGTGIEQRNRIAWIDREREEAKPPTQYRSYQSRCDVAAAAASSCHLGQPCIPVSIHIYSALELWHRRHTADLIYVYHFHTSKFRILWISTQKYSVWTWVSRT